MIPEPPIPPQESEKVDILTFKTETTKQDHANEE